MATTKTEGNLAICLAPNLLSPPQMLTLDVLALETGKVRCVHHPATASPAQPSFAAQRSLAASSCQQSHGQQPGRAAPRLHLPAQKHRSGWERLFEPSSAPSVKPVVCCVQVTQLMEFLIDHHEELLGEEVAGLAREGDEETPAPKAELETAEVPPVAPESEEQRSFSGEKR
ncbi:uncharacterized protein LOC133213446 isoform X1 [Neopsephotus bourkii]|uniref:uncharacterized protein LOC133213446 isoform X1 n=1 Tax=Neopsephotus bourkii TaxID=309878 RepID=UPI002AA520E3|nr:uncharacterized protein LOC133213446 isoform X1 [Neopsephotus bourkii]